MIRYSIIFPTQEVVHMRQFKRKWTLDRQKFLSKAAVRKLRRVVEDKALADLQKGRTTWPRFWMTIDLAVSAGLRVSEIAGLKIENLYLNSREPRILVTGKAAGTRTTSSTFYLDLITLPGLAFVCRPSSTTTCPLTMTHLIPGENCLGWS